ncbi:site-specific integrase [Devosia sp.]|uniref:tyrosine-type recombinase/integrase n=1 Tax=Devosia sp. TaxID=1871048 RepID=UPI00261C1C5B|nr:site-specific integrase [Devosia sp.]
MSQKLTDTIIKTLPVPVSGNRISYDTEVKGFGCRVTAGGARSFILNYRTRSGRERRYTIGQFPAWKTGAARAEAGELKKAIDRGDDPLASLEADRGAKTVADLVVRFREEHLPKTRSSTARNYGLLIDKFILPELRHHRVAEVGYTDIDGLHRKVTKTGAPYQANRSVAVLSKMFTLAIRWGWRTDNPAKGIERNPEEKRHRYLSPAELAKLTDALASAEDVQAANIVRLLLLTGARSGEVMAARWDQIDLTSGVWTKPGSTTKQKTLHRVPLSAPARQLLVDIRLEAEAAVKKRGRDVSDFVFPGRGSPHRVEIKYAWVDLCVAAGIITTEAIKDAKGRDVIKVRPSARIHDLRHTYASVLASAGLSLPIIGALLGHSQPATTARYSHLMDDPLRAATERAGAIVTARGAGAEVIAIEGNGR